jgi:ribosomal protein S18 acetylase RimI-like enzyme
MVTIRAFRPDDLDDLHRICLETATGGGATAVRDPKLVGHVYAGPYAALSPPSVFVVEDGHGVGGYVLGAPDTRRFEARLEAEWWPGLRDIYTNPSERPRAEWSFDQLMIYRMYHPHHAPSEIVEGYPSHLHINLLPRLRGRGLGRRLIDRWFLTIQEMGSHGAHLAVGAANLRAIRFYRAYGFWELHPPSPASSDPIWFGITLSNRRRPA